MKQVLIHGAMHTGSTFTRILLSTCSSYVHPTNRQYTTEEQIVTNNKLNTVLKNHNVVLTEFKDGLKILATHHLIIDKPLGRYLKNNQCPIPVIMTMRDPLLVSNTFTWRHIMNKVRPIQLIDWYRQQNTKRNILLTLESIKLYKTNKCFMFPIDLENSKDKAIEMFSYCNFKITDRTKLFIREWQHKNVTAKVMTSKNKPLHQEAKEAIKNKDIKTIEKLLPIELAELRRSKKLQQELKDIGYKDLVWW